MSVAPVPGVVPRVMLHIGAPKSGTTFLQRALWRHHDALADEGFLVAGESHRDMFHAAIEVRGAFAHWGLSEESLTGTWARLCQQARDFPGTTIMSHEVLVPATQEQVDVALRSLDGVDLHLVFTARDLARQVLSEWQERVKNGSTQTFDAFAASIGRQRRRRDGGPSASFWRNQDVLAAFERWGAGVREENLHLVVAPPTGADPGELWRRFGAAVGFSADDYDPSDPSGVANQTLGVTQTSLLRKVNEALDGRIQQPAYARVVKRQFSQRLLAGHRSPRPSCPPELLAELREVSQAWVAEIARRGWRVHGDLDELVPSTALGDGPLPDQVDPRQEADLSAAVIADLLVEKHRRRGAEQGSASGEVPGGAPAAAVSGPVGPGDVRRRLLGALGRVRAGAAGAGQRRG